MEENASLGVMLSDDPDGQVVGRRAQRALRRRQEAYSDEVRRLIAAGTEVMRRFGTTRSPRVADILDDAGLSRDAFYRHFASKEDLVEAIVEVGAMRLVSYLDHQMGKVESPEEKIRQWVRGVMSQATDPDVACTTRAVLWNGSRVAYRTESFDSVAVLSDLLIEPLAAVSSPDPRRDARTIGFAVMGQLRAALGEATTPNDADVEHLVHFCQSAVGISPARRSLPAGGPDDSRFHL
jgi:AcrR family transcriptional regulator